MLRCRICGETYLGTDAPSRCPFCGASAEFFVDDASFSSAEDDVQLTEVERSDLESAVELERSNARYYVAMARMEGDEALASAYKRLSRIEAEHCSLFCRLLREPKPDDLGMPEGDPGSWCEAIAESAAREHRASEFYAQAAQRATNPRIREVLSAISAVEADHIALDEVAARHAGCLS